MEKKTGNKILINGDSPFVYAMERKDVLTIHGKDFIDYYTRYRLQSKGELLAELNDAKIDINAYFSNIFSQMWFRDIKDKRLVMLNDLYQALVESRGDALLNKNSPFVKMISNADTDVRVIAYEMQRMKVDPDVLLNLKKVSDLNIGARIDLIAAWVKATIPQPPEYLITNEIKDGVADFDARVREAEMLGVIIKANKDQFATFEHAKQYSAELRARPELYSKYRSEFDALTSSSTNFDYQSDKVWDARSKLTALEAAKSSMAPKEYEVKVTDAREALTTAERALDDAVKNRISILKVISPTNKIKLVYQVENHSRTCLEREEMIRKEGQNKDLGVYTSVIERAFNYDKEFAASISAAAKEMFEALEKIRVMPKNGEPRAVDSNSAEKANWTDTVQDDKQRQVPGSERSGL